jgi:hypothetical protein
MSRWSEQFQSHQIHQSLRQLKDWLDVEIQDIDSEHEEEKRRLLKVFDEIEGALTKVDPELFPEQPLTQLNQQLRQSQVWNNLKNYSSTPQVQQLREANNYLTEQFHSFVKYLFTPPPTEASGTLRNLEKAYDKFCRAIEKREEDFSARLEALESAIQEIRSTTTRLTSALDGLEKQTEQALSEWQAEFTSGQTSRAEAFSTDQIDRMNKFDAALREWRDKSEAAIRSISAEHSEKLSRAFEAFSQSIDEKLADAAAKHANILEIHGLVGKDGVAGGYQRNAEDEHRAAIIWRRVAMGSFIAAGVWILLRYCLGFEANVDGSINWPEVASAASLTLVFLGMGGYAARQSGTHREAEQQMRWFALEVNALDPFLSSLPEDKQNDLKNDLTKKFFGQNRVTTAGRDAAIDPSVVKLLSEAFQSVLKAAGKG